MPKIVWMNWMCCKDGFWSFFAFKSKCCKARQSGCGYRIFKISRNGGSPAAIVTGIVAEMMTLGLGNVREQALSWRAGALLGERMRNGPASTCVASGGASFVTMVKTADLRDRDQSAQLRRMHFPWFRRVLLERQMRTGRVIVRKIRRQDSAQTGLITNDHVIQAFPPN